MSSEYFGRNLNKMKKKIEKNFRAEVSESGVDEWFVSGYKRELTKCVHYRSRCKTIETGFAVHSCRRVGNPARRVEGGCGRAVTWSSRNKWERGKNRRCGDGSRGRYFEDGVATERKQLGAPRHSPKQTTKERGDNARALRLREDTTDWADGV